VGKLHFVKHNARFKNLALSQGGKILRLGWFLGRPGPAATKALFP
jgi:hypothetical protein